MHVPADPGCEGAALIAHRALTGEAPPRWSGDPWLGEAVLEGPADDARELADDEAVVDTLLEHLLAGHVVGWMRGRAEWHGHGVGHRVLLADPRDPASAERLGQRIKLREGFRPWHPAAPAEDVGDWFELPAGGRSAAEGLRIEVPGTSRCRAQAPAAVHVDGSARPLPVDAARDPLFHALLTRFGAASGVPLLLVTSLNPRAEPPLRTEVEAREFADRTELECLVVERRVYGATARA